MGGQAQSAWPARFALLLLAAHGGFALHGLHRQSVTIDEFAHLPAGISHWQKGTFFVYSVNPPLMKMVAALPVLTQDPVMPYTEDFRPLPGRRYEWQFGRDFMQANAERYLDLFFVGRYPIVALSVLGGWFVFLWARELFGASAGVLATALWAFCPNILAHAQLVTPDLGGTTFALISCYGFWHWLKQPSWLKTSGAGLLLGIAQLTKFTSLILYPSWAILAVVWLVRPPSTHSSIPRAGAKAIVAQFATIVLLSLLVLNAGYGFEGSLKRLGDYDFVSKALTDEHLQVMHAHYERDGTAFNRHQVVRDNRFRGGAFENLVIPLPEHYLYGLDFQQRDFERPVFPSYLRGELRWGGWWYYYFYAFAVKLPLGTLSLLGLAVIAVSCRNGDRPWQVQLAVLLPAGLVFGVVSSETGFTDHFRYVLPAFPFLFIFVSQVAGCGTDPTRQSSPRWLRRLLPLAAVVCVLWNFGAAMRVHPHHLSYFNELAGGPKGGPRHLINSNVDWAQDLLALKQWLAKHPEATPIGLAYFNFVDPRVAGIDFDLPPQEPTAGWYAVSVNFVYGLWFAVPDGQGRVAVVPEGAYTYFRELEPVARAGYSILIYRVTEEQAIHLRAKLEN